MTSLIRHLEQCLAQYFKQTGTITNHQPAFGGDINTCFSLNFGEHALFVKSNSHAAAADMFKTEFEGLQAIRQSNTVLCPKPLFCEHWQNTALLVMEFVALSGQSDWPALARQLAAMHKTAATRFGFASDNFIGTTPQINQWHESWSGFWWHTRLAPQLDLAIDRNGIHKLKRQYQTIKTASDKILSNHNPQPSLVHGDLWSGNVGFLESNTPVIYDPACYFGDREVDIAMTRLFGGFPQSFYHTYESLWPMPRGYEIRFDLYNLYHMLNHLNLFGGSYINQCEMLIQKITSN